MDSPRYGDEEEPEKDIAPDAVRDDGLSRERDEEFELHRYRELTTTRTGLLAPFSEEEKERFNFVRETIYTIVEGIGRSVYTGKALGKSERKRRGIGLEDIPPMSREQSNTVRALCDLFRLLKEEAKTRTPRQSVIDLKDVPLHILQAEAKFRKEREKGERFDGVVVESSS